MSQNYRIWTLQGLLKSIPKSTLIRIKQWNKNDEIFKNTLPFIDVCHSAIF